MQDVFGSDNTAAELIVPHLILCMTRVFRSGLLYPGHFNPPKAFNSHHYTKLALHKS